MGHGYTDGITENNNHTRATNVHDSLLGLFSDVIFHMTSHKLVQFSLFCPIII